jgi:chemotaxis protein methyltransferase CheR
MPETITPSPAPGSGQSAPDYVELSPASFERFARFITRELGIKMPQSKLTMVQSRLLRRSRELGLASVERYAEYFFSDSHAEERQQFINAITTNKTDFFREPSHFHYLMRVCLPAIALHPGRRPENRLHVWSCGCSSGEEAYTLAMLLSEHAHQHQGFDFAILATDVSTRVLEHGRAGVYTEAQIEPVPPELRRRYILRGRDRAQPLVRMSPELRRRIAFRQLNLMDAAYPIRAEFDVVFFRNVMIYFDRSTQEAIVNRIAANLAPGGYLFTGHSESLTGMRIPLRPVAVAVFRKPEE